MEFAQQKHKNHDCDNSLSYYEFGNLKKTLKHFIKFETAFVALKKNVQQTQTTFKSTCTLKHYFRVHFIQTFYSNILFKNFIQTFYSNNYSNIVEFETKNLRSKISLLHPSKAEFDSSRF